MPPRAESPPHDGEHTRARRTDRTRPCRSRYRRTAGSLVAELGHALPEAAAHQLVELDYLQPGRARARHPGRSYRGYRHARGRSIYQPLLGYG